MHSYSFETELVNLLFHVRTDLLVIRFGYFFKLMGLYVKAHAYTDEPASIDVLEDNTKITISCIFLNLNIFLRKLCNHFFFTRRTLYLLSVPNKNVVLIPLNIKIPNICTVIWLCKDVNLYRHFHRSCEYREVAFYGTISKLTPIRRYSYILIWNRVDNFSMRENSIYWQYPIPTLK